MNRLFGVTMAERGVSQLVSVDLESAVKILDQNVATAVASWFESAALPRSSLTVMDDPPRADDPADAAPHIGCCTAVT